MHIRVAANHRERMRGLRGLDRLEADRGLLIPRCRSVHTFGMRFPIQVAYLARDGRVLEVVRMPPGRLARPRFRARHVLETAVDTRLPQQIEVHR